MLNLTYSYKLQPSKKQMELIERNLTVCKSVWNHALYVRKLWYKSRSCKINQCSLFHEYIVEPFEYPNYHAQSAELTLAKKTNPFLKSGNAQAMQQTLRKLDRAFNDMKSKGMGFPRYKKKAKSFNLLGKISVEGNYINLFGKQSLDMGLGQFFNILEYVCSKTDTYFAKVDKNYTSQICSNCGTHTGKKDLNERIHHCSECGYIQNRDIVASEVVRDRGLENIAVGAPVIKQPSYGGLAGTTKSS